MNELTQKTACVGNQSAIAGRISEGVGVEKWHIGIAQPVHDA